MKQLEHELNIHLHITLRLRICGALPLLLLYAFMMQCSDTGMRN